MFDGASTAARAEEPPASSPTPSSDTGSAASLREVLSVLGCFAAFGLALLCWPALGLAAAWFVLGGIACVFVGWLPRGMRLLRIGYLANDQHRAAILKCSRAGRKGPTDRELRIALQSIQYFELPLPLPHSLINYEPSRNQVALWPFGLYTTFRDAWNPPEEHPRIASGDSLSVKIVAYVSSSFWNLFAGFFAMYRLLFRLGLTIILAMVVAFCCGSDRVQIRIWFTGALLLLAYIPVNACRVYAFEYPLYFCSLLAKRMSNLAEHYSSPKQKSMRKILESGGLPKLRFDIENERLDRSSRHYYPYIGFAIVPTLFATYLTQVSRPSGWRSPELIIRAMTFFVATSFFGFALHSFKRRRAITARYHAAQEDLHVSLQNSIISSHQRNVIRALSSQLDAFQEEASYGSSQAAVIGLLLGLAALVVGLMPPEVRHEGIDLLKKIFDSFASKS